ncbi:MAG: extracellular solute-binding protein [Mesorhizobium sp.]|uniref:extracellular solute-binding protein n=1 Tax=Mesorhizobium sp. TaxID=1871066 RepID=UPI001AC8FF8C|nr:extracellular solute-binding protein [Mesorhizobium sp.]MBN9221185.1 extracellular solute-binding protein [Mesorhizobium sp.]
MKRLVLLMLAAFSAAVSCPARAEDPVVNIDFWYDYLPQQNIDQFAKDTGIKVVYDSFNSVEMLTTKILTGGSGYDIVMPGASMISQFAQIGALQKLDKNKLPNAGSLDPVLMKFLATQDPANEYAVPYAYGATGLLYNKSKIEQRLEQAPTDSWDLLFKPEFASKLSDCGIGIIDAPDQIMGIALHYLGFNPYTKSEDEIRKADALLKAIRPYIRHFKTESLQNEMASGDLCLAVTWTGTAVAAQNAAQQNGTGAQLGFSIPKEGSDIFFDVMAIPADAPHPENALAFINFLISANAAATFTNNLLYPNAVLTARPLVDRKITDNPNVYIPEDVLKRLYPDQQRDPKSMRTVVRAWTSFTTGQD